MEVRVFFVVFVFRCRDFWGGLKLMWNKELNGWDCKMISLVGVVSFTLVFLWSV